MSIPLGSNLPSVQRAQLAQLFAPIEAHIQQAPFESRHWVACSGGLDSMLLLWAMATLVPKQLCVIHINHGLHPDALQWADQVTQLCSEWQLSCSVRTVNLASEMGNLEARARAARYAIFAEIMQPQDVLWMAHHLNDQVETFFMRLARGSGLDGLLGIPQQRPLGQGHLFRPWLQLPRSFLLNIAKSLGLQWIEDSSNDNEMHTRNFIRHQVMPPMLERWPHLLDSVATTLQHLSEAQRALQNPLEHQLHRLLATDGSLNISVWLTCGALPQQLSLLRLWLRRHGVIGPPQVSLQQIHSEVALARPDAQGQVAFTHGSVRRFQGHLHWVPSWPELPQQLPLKVHPEGGFVLTHPGIGCFRLVPCVGSGIALVKLQDQSIQVRFRQGGESMHPVGRKHRRDGKRLMQEFAIPPWWRHRTPLLFVEDQWVAMGDLCIDQDWAAQPGQSGLKPIWHRVGETI